MTAIPLTFEIAYIQAEVVDEERSLVERAKSDPEALAMLYRKFQPRIAAYVFRRIGRSHETEDIVADVFLGMVKGLMKYRDGDTPFVAWLYRIATNEINRSLRKRRVRTFFGLSIDLPTRSQESNDDGEDLRRALTKLPIVFQTVLALYYLEELSIEEIAVVTNCPTGTVKSRLARGRNSLRTLLEVTNQNNLDRNNP